MAKPSGGLIVFDARSENAEPSCPKATWFAVAVLERFAIVLFLC